MYTRKIIFDYNDASASITRKQEKNKPSTYPFGQNKQFTENFSQVRELIRDHGVSPQPFSWLKHAGQASSSAYRCLPSESGNPSSLAHP